MADEHVPASCFFDGVQFTAELPTLFCGHCHCSLCRRPHAAAFVAWTAAPPNWLFITAGHNQTEQYQNSPNGARSFCEPCGDQLFCQVEPGVVDVAMTALHGPIDRAPEDRYYCDSHAQWGEVNDDLLKLGGTHGMQPLD